MHTLCNYGSYVLVEFNDAFDCKEIMRLMQHESFGGKQPTEHAIWNIGKHAARLTLGELPALVEGAQQGTKNGVRCAATAIVTHHPPTRMIMQLLADGLQKRLHIRCRTFRTMEEAQRWFAYLSDSPSTLVVAELAEAVPA